MKIIKSVKLDKYEDTQRYSPINEHIYKNLQDNNFNLTLYCELENGDDTQYPLEDILDKYYVNCTDYIDEQNVEGKHIYIFELEGSLGNESQDFKDILEVSQLIGKRVFNYEDSGYIKLKIE